MRELDTSENKKILTLMLITEPADHIEYLYTPLELTLFLINYSFILNDNATEGKILKQDFYPHGGIFFQNSNGARYLDPKYSRWLSTDPALGEYIPAAGKGTTEEAGNLPGMGGIYNHLNAGLYHYAGNNPVRYIDPDGREAGKLFNDIDDLAKDFALNYNDDSIRLNRELGASIYKTKDNQYYYTIPYKGSKTSVHPTELAGEKRFGVIHTHTFGFQMDMFSDTDIIIANKENIISYIVLSDGGLLKYDPSKPYNPDKNPTEILKKERFPNKNNYDQYPENELITNPFSKFWYYLFGDKK